MRKNLINIAIFSFLSLPLVLWLLWIIKPQFKANILIMDKTVLTKEYLKHNAFNWIISHNKYVKPDGLFYSLSNDYNGFFPLTNDTYKIKDFSKLTKKQISILSDFYDMAYYADTYGVYTNEWYRDKNPVEYSEKIYGGLDEGDVYFLSKMKEKGKLIIAEFNFFATPTTSLVRNEAENLFGLKWSGWTGCYFAQLDTINNPGLPKWIVRLYKEQHLNTWPFTKPGIVFIHSDESIVILEKDTDLKFEAPKVMTYNYGVNKFKIPKVINYPYWFEITESSDINNKVVSYYEILTNNRGDSILQHHNIPKVFPATFENTKSSPFYYFCGDFTNSRIDKTTYKVLGINYLKMFGLNKNDLNDRSAFFWLYSLPITTTIIDNYFKK